MKLTASLPMYDFPEVRWALDILWKAVARRLDQAGSKEFLTLFSMVTHCAICGPTRRCC